MTTKSEPTPRVESPELKRALDAIEVQKRLDSAADE